MIEILEPHQRADALVQRMLVADHGGRVVRAASRQSVILPRSCRRGLSGGPPDVPRPRAPARGSGGRARPPAARWPTAAPRCPARRRRARAALRPGQLGGHDRAHFGGLEAAPRHDAADLLVLRAIDDQHAVDAGQAAAFEEQRDDEQAVGAVPGRDLPARRRANQRVQDRLEPGPRGGVAEHELRAGGAIERAVGVGGTRARTQPASPRGRAARRGERVGEASVSVTSTPSAANASATADLPLPMPPVRPTTTQAPSERTSGRARGRRTARWRRRWRDRGRTRAGCCGRGP